MDGVSEHFIEDDDNDTDSSVTECLEAIGVLKKKVEKPQPALQHLYKLGEVIANGVRYFGQNKTVDNRVTSMCICPRCGETWRVLLSYVKTGRIKSCGCKK